MNIPIKTEKYFHHENIKMSIVLDNYCIKPEGFIEGSIILTPILKDNTTLKDPKIILTLTQYEYFDYSNEKESAKHNQQHKEIIFNKEAKIEIENNTISSTVQIPIKVSMPMSKKLLPSFNLKNKDINCGIRHIFTVNIPEIKAINSIGILISELNKKKSKDKDENNNIIFRDEQINKMGLINKGKISYVIRTAKNEYKNDENIDIKIMVDSRGLQEINIEKIRIKLQRKIINFGYTVNSDFRYTLHDKIFEKDELSKKNEKNSNKYELEYTIPKTDENNFNEKGIEQYVHFDQVIIDNHWKDKCLAPSVKGYLFGCEYKIKIRTILDSSLITTKKIDLPILIYFPDEYFNKFKLDFKKEEDVKFGSFILISHSYNKADDINNIAEDKNKEEDDIKESQNKENEKEEKENNDVKEKKEEIDKEDEKKSNEDNK